MTLPLQSHPFNAGGPVDPVWLAWLRTLEQGTASDNAALASQISAIATALGSPDGTVANIPPLGASQTQVFQGAGIQVDGNAHDGYQISLRSVADSGAGSFLLITKDSFGRVTGTIAGTAADVPYDNTTSGLTADDVQAAVDELSAEKLDDAPSDGTTYGRKDGAWVAAGGGGSSAWTTIKKTADEVRSSTATYADDAALKFSAAAGTTYQIRCRMFFDAANATMDLKVQPNFTGTTNSVMFRRVIQIDNNTFAYNIGNAFAALVPNLLAAGYVYFDFEITLDVNTAGTFSVQWAQNTSNAGNLTCHKGSYLEYMTL